MFSASSLSHPFVWMMIVLIFLLAIVIKSLAGILLNAARDSGAGGPGASKDQAITVLAAPMLNGVSDTAFYMITGVLAVEILVILLLHYNVNLLLKAGRIARPAFSLTNWWSKVPAWRQYALYGAILIAVVSLWRYQASQTDALQAEASAIAVRQAAAERSANLKQAVNSIDENTVTLLTTPADLDSGKAVFTTTCFACHGMNGEGTVGPNLTDNYWLHGGSIRELFKTIKYGWPEKGMKAWKDDYSPLQIAQIASYVKSLGGTNPANPKPPQGELISPPGVLR